MCDETLAACDHEILGKRSGQNEESFDGKSGDLPRIGVAKPGTHAVVGQFDFRQAKRNSERVREADGSIKPGGERSEPRGNEAKELLSPRAGDGLLLRT